MMEYYKTYPEWAAPDDSSFLCKRSQIDPLDKNGPLARTAFEHDRDRIIHSRAFRRLMHKTQIFNSKTNDHIRNRLTHTMEVYQIARGIGKPLGLNDVLIEAIALGHDLGHTPFGHVGERTLHSILMGHSKRAAEKSIPKIDEGFKHNYQGLAVLDYLETGKQEGKGLNITLAVREGIFKHTGRKMKVEGEKEEVKYSQLNLEYLLETENSFTLEGQTVAIADEIAQCTHDLEDALRQRIISIADLREMSITAAVLREYNIELKENMNTNDIRMTLLYRLINKLITDVYYASVKKLDSMDEPPSFEDEHSCIREKIIDFSPEIAVMARELDRIKTEKNTYVT